MDQYNGLGHDITLYYMVCHGKENFELAHYFGDWITEKLYWFVTQNRPSGLVLFRINF
jgi:hypothetical protein